MRIDAFRARNLGPFKDFSFDLADYEGATLIAVTGANGAGKSTALELAIPGAIYRNTPTRGSLQDLSTARDSMLEVRVTNGRSWTIRHLTDKLSGKSEAVVLDESGRSVLDSAKVKEFDAWAARHFPPSEVLFSSLFGAQGSEGFLGLKPTARKAVLLRALGLEKLEALAADAKERASRAAFHVEMLSAKLPALAGYSVTEADAAVEAAEIALSEAQSRANDIARNLEVARIEAADHTLLLRRWEENQQAREKLTADIKAAEEKLADVRRKVANNEAVLQEAEQIRTAVERLPVVEAELQVLLREIAEAKHKHELRSAERATLERDQKELKERLTKLDRELAFLPVHETKAAMAGELRSEVTRWSELVSRLERVVSEMQDASLIGATGRIAILRGGLTDIADGASDPEVIARETMTRDDDVVREAAEHPERLRAAQRELSDARKSLAECARSLTEAELAEGSLRSLTERAAERDRVTAQLGEKSTALRELYEIVGPPDQSEKVRSMEGGLEIVRRLVAKADPLSRAEARLGELVPQSEELERSIVGLREQLEALPVQGERPDGGPAIEKLEADKVEADKRVMGAAGEVGAARSRAEAAREAEAARSELTKELNAAHLELSDWKQLAADLGRDGIQAAEIDAAGPELTALVNDLLHTCVGTRFTVSIETARLSADGKKLLEGCDVRVIDTERGRDDEASTFSGGERVIIGEAVSLALSMLACRRAGLSGITLVRDESGAALDPANARAYIAMLRRAAEIVGARNVLFVSHSPEVIEMADARIEVQN